MNNIKILPSLLVFSEVTKRQSFTEAAKHLKLSKASVSQHIKKLEEQVGQQLLSRNTRGMSLTTAGERLLNRSALLQDQVELAFREIASIEQTPKGPFSFTIPHVLEKEVAIPALRQLCVEFPQIEPRVIVTDQPLDLIENNLDAAIYAGPLKDSSYKVTSVGSIRGIFCASPAYLQQYGIPETLADLNEHRWIKAQWQNAPLKVISTKDKEVVSTINLEPFAIANTLACASEMAAQDMGLVFFSEIANHKLLKEGKLIHILKDYHSPPLGTYMLHPFQGEKPMHISRFSQLIKYYLSQTTLTVTK